MTRWRILSALASGLLLALAFPSLSLSWLAWVALVPLLWASLGARPRLGFLCGWLHGAVFFGVTFSWIYTFLRGFGGLSVAGAAGVWGLLIVARACFPGAFGLGVAYLDRSRRPWALLCAPFLWVALEWALAHLPDINFIWNLLGYAVSGNLGLLQVASWTSVYGLASILVAYNVLVVWLLLERTRRAGIAWAASTVVLLGVLIVGPRLLPAAPAHHVARLVQLNIPVAASYQPNWTESHAAELNELAQLSDRGMENPPDVVVWPEAPAPLSVEDPNFATLAQSIARTARTNFLVGVDDWRPGPEGGLVPHNSAALLDASGQRVFLYDKIKLVPFGEYVPWRRVLFFAKKLTGEIGDFEPGTSYKVGSLPGGTFSVLICYEAIFPAEVRQFVANGAQLLLNVSDDGWYGQSAALAQHLNMARVRAAENRRWLLRDTNTGYTVAVDPYGRIAARLAPDIRGVLIAPYDYRSDRTVYVRWGNWWPWLCVVVAAGLLLAGKFQRNASPGG